MLSQALCLQELSQGECLMRSGIKEQEHQRAGSEKREEEEEESRVEGECVCLLQSGALHPMKAPEGRQERLLGRWKALLTPPSRPVPGPQRERP